MEVRFGGNLVVVKDAFRHVICFFWPKLPGTCLIFDLDKVKVKTKLMLRIIEKNLTKMTTIALCSIMTSI